MKKISIHGDGWDAVFVDEDGNKIEGVYEATIRMRANEPTTVELEIHMPQTVIQADVTEVTFSCPVCGDTLTHEHHQTTLAGT